jgi:hypothetical protein
VLFGPGKQAALHRRRLPPWADQARNRDLIERMRLANALCRFVELAR